MIFIFISLKRVKLYRKLCIDRYVERRSLAIAGKKKKTNSEVNKL